MFAIEAEVRGHPAEERRAVRQARAGPLLEDLHRWFHATLSKLSRKSPLAIAIRYALTRWTALTRYRDDGRLELENNAAERALRAVALGRKNFLFLGADTGGERAEVIYSLIGTAKLNSLRYINIENAREAPQRPTRCRPCQKLRCHCGGPQSFWTALLRTRFHRRREQDQRSAENSEVST